MPRRSTIPTLNAAAAAGLLAGALVVAVAAAATLVPAWAEPIPVPPPAAPAAPAEPAAPAAAPPIALGERVARFTFFDIRYLERSLDDFKERAAFVVVFVADACPLAGRYLARLAEMEREYRARGVQFLAVNEEPGASVVQVAAAAVDHGLEFPLVKDLDGGVARAVGATRTPEVVVLDAARRLRYRGRIDDQYRLGGEKPAAGRADLRAALEDVLAGVEVRVPETTVDGCRITFPAAPGGVPAGASVPAAAATPVPTWAEHIAPILRAHCQSCHREGGDGPFSLTAYEDARRRAAVIAEAVELGRMPPWFADPRYGHFENARGLTDEERRAVLAWARGGAPAGDPACAPEPLPPVKSKWKISQPDLVLRLEKEIKVPATGYMPYQYAPLHQVSFLPYLFTEDTWVQEIQILPRNRRVLHHANLFWADAREPKKSHHFICGEVPGGEPMRLAEGTGFMIPKGAVLALQMHYVPCGVEASDLISVGIVYAKSPIHRRLQHFEVHNSDFTIPAGAPAYEVKASKRLERDSTGLGMHVHMHLRGRDMRFAAVYPCGMREPLLLVPNYSFDWQVPYVWADGGKKFPAGTVIECTAHYDNSAFNPYNPDATQPVPEGQETVNEMMFGFFFFIEEGEDPNVTPDPKTGRAVKAEGGEGAPGAEPNAGESAAVKDGAALGGEGSGR
ncbi:MAG: redoxin domain-containing protein [Planctomycetes bacterium]|nr:redoxin domain-containing protein [Planctomycetota bacterium]